MDYLYYLSYRLLGPYTNMDPCLRHVLFTKQVHSINPREYEFVQHLKQKRAQMMLSAIKAVCGDALSLPSILEKVSFKFVKSKVSVTSYDRESKNLQCKYGTPYTMNLKSELNDLVINGKRVITMDWEKPEIPWDMIDSKDICVARIQYILEIFLKFSRQVESNNCLVKSEFS
jgi:hypothetical protein